MPTKGDTAGDPAAAVPPPNVPVWTAADEARRLQNLIDEAPEIHDILARPQVYEAWLAKAKEALNG